MNDDNSAKIEKKEYMRKYLGFDTFDLSHDSAAIEKKAIGIPQIAPFADWDYYYLLSPIRWEPEGDAITKYSSVEVPKGFVTDLASTPKFLWPILPPTKRYTHAAIVHDYHYWTQTISRTDADDIFKIAMGELDVPGWTSFAIYQAVSKFGDKAWNNNKKLQDLGESRFMRKAPKEPTITWADWKTRGGVMLA